MNIVQAKKKNSGFRSYTLRTYLIYRVFPGYLNLKLF